MNDHAPADEELMTRYRDGDAGAFEVLYLRHRGAVYRYFLRHCGEQATAEEMYQDVWMNLIRARHRYRPSAKFSTYLYTLAHHRLVDHYRRHAPHAMRTFEEFVEDAHGQVDRDCDPPETVLDRRRLVGKALAVLQALPPPQREVFLLREEGGLSLGEIAAATGVGRETAKSRLRYAVARLRAALGSEQEHSDGQS